MKKTEEDFDKFVNNIKINEEKDFFKGKRTILNNKFAALKQAHMFAKEQATINRGFWVDPEFGESVEDENGLESLFSSEVKLLSAVGVSVTQGVKSQLMNRRVGFEQVLRQNNMKFDWKRLKEISTEREPVFIENDAKSADVHQGSLGDCWLIGAMSLIGSRDELLTGGLDLRKLDVEGELTDEQVSEATKLLHRMIFRQNFLKIFEFFRFFGSFFRLNK